MNKEENERIFNNRFFPCYSSVDSEIWESIERIEKEMNGNERTEMSEVEDEKENQRAEVFNALIPYYSYESI